MNGRPGDGGPNRVQRGAHQRRVERALDAKPHRPGSSVTGQPLGQLDGRETAGDHGLLRPVLVGHHQDAAATGDRADLGRLLGRETDEGAHGTGLGSARLGHGPRPLLDH
jgi:hypothetical protein